MRIKTLFIALALLGFSAAAPAQLGVFDALDDLERAAGDEEAAVPLTINGRVVRYDGQPIANTELHFLPPESPGGGGLFDFGSLIPDLQIFEGVPISCLTEAPSGGVRTDSSGQYTLNLAIRASCAREHRGKLNARNFKLRVGIEGHDVERADGALPTPVRVRGNMRRKIQPQPPSGGFPGLDR